MALNKNNINYTTAVILLVYNLSMIVFGGVNTVEIYINLSIPVIALIFIFMFKNKNIYIFYTIVGVLITIFGTVDNFSGSIFFFLSMYDNKNKRNIYSNVFSISSSLIIKTYLSELHKIDGLFIIVAFYFIISHMYVRFWNITDVKSKIGLNRGLTVEQLQTIEKLIEGKSHSIAAKELHIERTTFSARLGSIRKRYDVSNDLQLGLALVEDGVITSNSLTNVKIDNKTLHKNL